MKSICTFLLAFLLGLGGYVLLVWHVVHKPLTIGAIRDYFEFKTSYLSSIAQERKILIFAGSNGRFSHRCETIERIEGVKCANVSVTADLGLDWQFGKYRPYLRPGDVVYMPLEYRPLPPRPTPSKNEALYVMAYDHAAFTSIYSLFEQWRIVFSFDIKDLVSGLGEMALARLGESTRFSPRTLTPQGDENSNDDRSAFPFRAFLRDVEPVAIDLSKYRNPSDWTDLTRVLKWSTDHGVRVIGGMPTTFADTPVPVEVDRFLASLYRSQGQCFLELPNRSLYPRSAFYDTRYHLVRSFQEAHTRALAPALADCAQNRSCGACDPDGGKPPIEESLNFRANNHAT